jgi:type II secretory pathway pseudopilin PulG
LFENLNLVKSMNLLNIKKIASKGQAVVEIVVALAIFALLASSLAVLLLGGFALLERGRQITQAGALAREGIEAVRSVRDRNYDELSYSRSAVTISGNQWVFIGEGTTETIGDFVRRIDLFPVYRDVGGNIVVAGDPGAEEDASSTRVTVNVSWETGSGVDTSISRTTYLTDWR